ncbi:hypothetical protein RO3G_07274 [Rhizopus delemar RA 99-880]|uniref:Uncharacterized protein n=1 Tax=Rhizopus delemar (strain RA 99-880 / ATCC MYA-4621 / FGSC 9543 / NRRL 43880) TaxID=246409 RepID=I1C289_RHIO9|nr:hypothetical protein RO3G_07274 [Rhizopus delemar RA 99-880]|eukprot:EIE82569.1 hypothetical protein RO3G_07274 [Rhizopus delemar RA 99-880]
MCLLCLKISSLRMVCCRTNSQKSKDPEEFVTFGMGKKCTTNCNYLTHRR